MFNMSPQVTAVCQEMLKSIADHYGSYFFRYDTRDDFTVVIQPLFNNLDMPKLPDGSVDTSYFAPDCFHFSGKAHAAAAHGLWNIMLKPVGKKSER